MKKLFITLVSLASITFSSHAAFTVAAPGQMALLGLFACGGGSAPSLTELAEEVVDCATQVPMAGIGLIDEGISPGDKGFFYRVFNIAIGLVVLDEKSGNVDLSKLDLSKLPSNIKRGEAIVYNNNLADIQQILDEMTGYVAGKKQISGQEVADEFEFLANDAKIPDEAKKVFFKVIRQ